MGAVGLWMVGGGGEGGLRSSTGVVVCMLFFALTFGQGGQRGAPWSGGFVVSIWLEYKIGWRQHSIGLKHVVGWRWYPYLQPLPRPLSPCSCHWGGRRCCRLWPVVCPCPTSWRHCCSCVSATRSGALGFIVPLTAAGVAPVATTPFPVYPDSQGGPLDLNVAWHRCVHLLIADTSVSVAYRRPLAILLLLNDVNFAIPGHGSVYVCVSHPDGRIQDHIYREPLSRPPGTYLPANDGPLVQCPHNPLSVCMVKGPYFIEACPCPNHSLYCYPFLF